MFQYILLFFVLYVPLSNLLIVYSCSSVMSHKLPSKNQFCCIAITALFVSLSRSMDQLESFYDKLWSSYVFKKLIFAKKKFQFATLKEMVAKMTKVLKLWNSIFWEIPWQVKLTLLRVQWKRDRARSWNKNSSIQNSVGKCRKVKNRRWRARWSLWSGILYFFRRKIKKSRRTLSVRPLAAWAWTSKLKTFYYFPSYDNKKGKSCSQYVDFFLRVFANSK